VDDRIIRKKCSQEAAVGTWMCSELHSRIEASKDALIAIGKRQQLESKIMAAKNCKTKR
jgi:uncharacterized protein YlaI